MRAQDAGEDDGVPLVENPLGGRQSSSEAQPPAVRAAGAGLISRALFLWVSPLLSLGRTRQLNMDDLPDLPDESRVEVLAACFGENLRAEIEREASGAAAPASGLRARLKLPPVFWALQRTFGRDFFRAGLFKLGTDTLQFFPAVVLADYLQALSGRRAHILARMGSTNDKGCAAAYALALFVLPLARTLVEQAYFYRVQLINMGVKASLQTAVYKKAVRLSNAAKSSGSTGETLNLMQMDASRISELMTYLHVCWSAAVQTIGYVTLLYTYIGWSVLGGLCAMFALVPIQNKVFRIIGVRRKKQMGLSDARVKMQNGSCPAMDIALVPSAALVACSRAVACSYSRDVHSSVRRGAHGHQNHQTERLGGADAQLDQRRALRGACCGAQPGVHQRLCQLLDHHVAHARRRLGVHAVLGGDEAPDGVVDYLPLAQPVQPASLSHYVPAGAC